MSILDSSDWWFGGSVGDQQGGFRETGGDPGIPFWAYEPAYAFESFEQQQAQWTEDVSFIQLEGDSLAQAVRSDIDSTVLADVLAEIGPGATAEIPFDIIDAPGTDSLPDDSEDQDDMSLLGDILGGAANAVGTFIGGVGGIPGQTPPFVGPPAETGDWFSQVGGYLGGVLIDKIGIGAGNPFSPRQDDPFDRPGGTIQPFFGEGTPNPGPFPTGGIPGVEGDIFEYLGQGANLLLNAVTFDNESGDIVGDTTDPGNVGSTPMASCGLPATRLPEMVTGAQLPQLGAASANYRYCGTDANGQNIFKKRRNRRKSPLTKGQIHAIATLKTMLSGQALNMAVVKVLS